MSTPPSIDEFEKLQLEIEERKKRLKSEMENLDRNLESVKKLKADREKAAQLYEAGLRELEETMLKASAQFEPREAKNDSKPTDSPSSPSPTPFSNKEKTSMKARVDLGMTRVKEEQQTINSPMRVSNKGCTSAGPSGTKDANDSGFSRKKQENEGQNSEARGERNVGEYSGRKGAIITNNSGVAEVNQGKSPRVRGKVKLIRLCDLKIISIIRENLLGENLKGFRESCFGRLLEIKELKCQGQLLLHLLWLVDRDASSKEKLVFKINNSNVEFGPKEFSNITGLRVGAWDGTIRASLSSSIRKTIFKGRPRILLKDLKDAFLRHKGKGELTLKLALLYFLYGTLLAGHNTRKIDLRYVDLIEDLHKFNEFPWGQVAYEFLASSFLYTRDTMATNRIRLITCGFNVALQVWVYEVIPSLAKHCAVRLNVSENLAPWILRWSTHKKSFPFDDLQRFFTPGDEAPLEDVTTDTNRQPDKENLPSDKDTAEDVPIIISDTDDDDFVFRRLNKRSRRDGGETRITKPRCTSTADSDSRSTDSDAGSCSSAHMNELVAACSSKENFHK